MSFLARGHRTVLLKIMKHSKIILRQAQNDAERSRSIKTTPHHAYLLPRSTSSRRRGAYTEQGDQIVKNQHFSILELLDRLLDKGVVVKGEVLLSVADIDLVYLNLGLLLSSVKTVEKAARKGNNGKTTLISWPACHSFAEGIAGRETSTQGEFLDEPQIEFGKEVSESKGGNGETTAMALPSIIDHGLQPIFRPKTNIDPKNVEKGLSKLVLTLVDLVRKLMEKQAVRRMEGGFLTAGEIERMGNAFLLLDEKMEQLKKAFGLKDEDLNLDLGPLGELI